MNYFNFFFETVWHVVVKISGHEWKTGRRERVNDVQHVHMLIGIVYRKVRVLGL